MAVWLIIAGARKEQEGGEPQQKQPSAEEEKKEEEEELVVTASQHCMRKEQELEGSCPTGKILKGSRNTWEVAKRSVFFVLLEKAI